MWDTPTIVAIVLASVSLGVACIALGLQFKGRSDRKRRAEKRVQIGKQLAAADPLFAQLAQLDPEKGPWDQVEAKIAAWRDETKAILPPEFRSKFESDAGMTFYVTQYEEQSRLRNYLGGRTARLVEIIGEL